MRHASGMLLESKRKDGSGAVLIDRQVPVSRGAGPVDHSRAGSLEC